MLIISNRAIRFFEIILRMKIAGLAFFPFIIVPTSTAVTERLLNHERIHLRQQLEMLIIFFYIVYLYEYYTKGYYNISFEKEAYEYVLKMAKHPLNLMMKYKEMINKNKRKNYGKN